MASNVQERAAQAAERAGAGTAQIEVERLPFDLSRLEGEGVLLDVDCVGFARLSTVLSWEDLGVELSDRAAKQVKPPVIRVLPQDRTKRFDYAAVLCRQALARYGLRFSLVETVLGTPAWRWVGWGAFDSFEAHFARGLSVLRDAKDAVLDDYPAVRAEIQTTLAEIAGQSRRRLVATRGASVPDDYETRVVATGLAAMPTPEFIHTGIFCRYRVGVLWLGSEMLAEQAATAEARSRLGGAQAEQIAQAENLRLATQTQRVKLETEERSARLRLQHEAAEASREAEVKDRIRQLKLAAAREATQSGLAPLREGIAQLHAVIHQEMTALRDSVERRGTLAGATAKRVGVVAEWYRAMNAGLFGDDTLSDLVESLEALATMPSDAGSRDVGAILAVGDDLIALTAEASREVARSGRFALLQI